MKALDKGTIIQINKEHMKNYQWKIGLGLNVLLLITLYHNIDESEDNEFQLQIDCYMPIFKCSDKMVATRIKKCEETESFSEKLVETDHKVKLEPLVTTCKPDTSTSVDVKQERVSPLEEESHGRSVVKGPQGLYSLQGESKSKTAFQKRKSLTRSCKKRTLSAAWTNESRSDDSTDNIPLNDFSDEESDWEGDHFHARKRTKLLKRRIPLRGLNATIENNSESRNLIVKMNEVISYHLLQKYRSHKNSLKKSFKPIPYKNGCKSNVTNPTTLSGASELVVGTTKTASEQVSNQEQADKNSFTKVGSSAKKNSDDKAPVNSDDEEYIKSVQLKSNKEANNKPKKTRTRIRMKSIMCEICGKCFRENNRLERHKNMHNNIRPYKCSTCGNTFVSQIDLKQHIKYVHFKINYQFICIYCGIRLDNADMLKVHEASHSLPEGAELPKPHKCPTCGKCFDTKKRMRVHYYSHLKRRRCTICRLVLGSEGSLVCHKEEVHGVKKEFKCLVCDKIFNKPHNLWIHKNKVHSELKFFCDICDKGFKQKHHIEQHMITHSDERPISCPECDETFKRKTHLKQHVAAFHQNKKR